MRPEPQEMPRLFARYEADFYHAAFGWPPDCLATGFPWLVSLEERFAVATQHGAVPPTLLVVEMILWGGNQNNVLGKFSKGLRSSRYETLICDVLGSLDYPRAALKCALLIDGFGLTYGSKLLRFCRPEVYGALDNRIRSALGSQLRRIHDGNVSSMCTGYAEFLDLLHQYQQSLSTLNIPRPGYGTQLPSSRWTAAEVEMALFAWATS